MPDGARRLRLRDAPGRRVGDVVLQDGRLRVEADDPTAESRLRRMFDETGEVHWGWKSLEDGEEVTFRAQPYTEEWLFFVVFNRLAPKGYWPDFSPGTD